MPPVPPLDLKFEGGAADSGSGDAESGVKAGEITFHQGGAIAVSSGKAKAQAEEDTMAAWILLGAAAIAGIVAGKFTGK